MLSPEPCPSPARRTSLRDIFPPFKTALALALVASAIWMWRTQWNKYLAQPATAISHRPYISAQFSPQIKTEQSWVAAQIGRQIVEIIFYAQKRTVPAGQFKFESGSTFDGKAHRFSTSIGAGAPIHAQLSTIDYVWSPAVFEPWVRSLIQGTHATLPASPSAFDHEFVDRLTVPRPDSLIREDLRLSDALTNNPLDSNLHEEAALLIGSFALREAAQDFADTRADLCAMSAHLAIAKGIRGKLSPCGELAEAVLCSLLGRQTPALAILDRLQRNVDTADGLPNRTAAIWIKALRMFNTGDYRQLEHPEEASLLERLEYFRALRYTIGSAAAGAFAEKNALERLSEWSARIMAGGFSVEDGHIWARRALATEMEECSTAYRNYSGKVLAPENFVSTLNVRRQQFDQSPDGSIHFHVLGWGAWAELHQRQFCELIESTGYWLRHMLGLPKEANEFERQISSRFGNLNLFPLISFEPAKRETKPIDSGVLALCRTHPDWITYQRWNAFLQRANRAGNERGKFNDIFQLSGWFHTRLPIGTTFDVSHRAKDNTLSALPIQQLEELKKIAPYDTSILWAHLQARTKFHPDADQIIQEFKEISDYNIWAMKTIASWLKNDPARYKPLFASICRLEPNDYFEFGDYLIAHNDEAGAVEAYQAGIDSAPDRVQASNSCTWLVEYYFEHGRKDDAFRIAKEMAEVYSATGLTTMARLLERAGKLEEAEEYFRKCQDRYEDHTDLDCFYLRNRGSSARYETAARESIARTFPNGFESVTITGLSGAPRDGVRITRTSDIAQKAGLSVGDILVAIDGHRLHNENQYFFLRDAQSGSDITYIMWRRNSYVELKASLPMRRNNTSLENYTSR